MMDTDAILQSIAMLQDEASGTRIRDLVNEATGQDLPTAAVYTHLQILERREFITSSQKDNQRIYRLAGKGRTRISQQLDEYMAVA